MHSPFASLHQLAVAVTRSIHTTATSASRSSLRSCCMSIGNCNGNKSLEVFPSFQQKRWRSRWSKREAIAAKERPGYPEDLASVSGLLILYKAKHVESSRMVQVRYKYLRALAKVAC